LVTFGAVHPLECLWTSWTYVIDSGAHSETQTALHRTVSLLVTLGGMVIFALVIGLVSDQVGEYVDSLRRGKSRVVEAGHTLIIGQGDKLLPTVIQICMANQSEGGGLIVVLTRLPKTQLEEAIADAQIDTLGSTVVIRTGSPFLPGDMLKVSAGAARSIILLADRADQAPDESDVMVVRTVLSLRAMGVPMTGGHITAEVCDLDNEELVHMVGDGRVETVVCHDVVGRLMIQCAQRKGLAQVRTVCTHSTVRTISVPKHATNRRANR
jgi:hypothetical protein